MTQNLPAKKPVDVLKNIINSESIQKRLKDALDESAGLFAMSVIDIYSSDVYLQKCDAGAVVQEAMKAAALKLPITKSLGFAYIVPYKGKPVFQIGYKGMIQLAMRSGQFKYLNADKVFEGETMEVNRLTGAVKIMGAATSDKAIGYFSHMELINGYEKTICWTTAQVITHAKKYSKSYANKSSAWTTNLDEMCIKTLLRNLLSKYAPMSVDFQDSAVADSSEPKDITPENNTDPPPKTDEEGNEEIEIDAEDMGSESDESGPGY